MGVGERLKAARLKKGYTQEELSKKIGVAPNTVWYIENAHQMGTSFEVIRRLCIVLGISADELLGVERKEK